MRHRRFCQSYRLQRFYTKAVQLKYLFASLRLIGGRILMAAGALSSGCADLKTGLVMDGRLGCLMLFLALFISCQIAGAFLLCDLFSGQVLRGGFAIACPRGFQFELV